MAERHGPVRTCIGCRQRGSRDELVRYVLRNGAAIVRDDERRLPGRGAWLHDSEECRQRATKRRAWRRALRSDVDVEDGVGHVTSPN